MTEQLHKCLKCGRMSDRWPFCMPCHRRSEEEQIGLQQAEYYERMDRVEKRIARQTEAELLDEYCPLCDETPCLKKWATCRHSVPPH